MGESYVSFFCGQKNDCDVPQAQRRSRPRNLATGHGGQLGWPGQAPSVHRGVYKSVCLYICIYIYMYIYIWYINIVLNYKHKCNQVYINIYLPMHTYVNTCTFIYIYIYQYVHTQWNTQIYIYIYTYDFVFVYAEVYGTTSDQSSSVCNYLSIPIYAYIYRFFKSLYLYRSIPIHLNPIEPNLCYII